MTVYLASAHHQALCLNMWAAQEIFETFLFHLVDVIDVDLGCLATLALEIVYVWFWCLCKSHHSVIFHFWWYYRFFTARTHFLLVLEIKGWHWENVLFWLRRRWWYNLRLLRCQICFQLASLAMRTFLFALAWALRFIQTINRWCHDEILEQRFINCWKVVFVIFIIIMAGHLVNQFLPELAKVR